MYFCIEVLLQKWVGLGGTKLETEALYAILGTVANAADMPYSQTLHIIP